MTVTNVDKDLEARTLTLDAEFDAPVERVWQLWADPRQLERWWGPPGYPATFTRHELQPGGRVDYHMTGPEGDQHHGYWEILEVDPPQGFLARDGFADADGAPSDALPTNDFRVALAGLDDGRTRMTITSVYPDTASLEQVLAMGMEEGITAAVGQIDAILAEDVATQRQ